MTKTTAIQDLLKYDHLVMSSEHAKSICKLFGVTAPEEEKYPDAFRPDGKPVIGVAAEELAEHICQKLNIKYVPQFGRSSQLRMCCKALSEAN